MNIKITQDEQDGLLTFEQISKKPGFYVPVGEFAPKDVVLGISEVYFRLTVITDSHGILVPSDSHRWAEWKFKKFAGTITISGD